MPRVSGISLPIRKRVEISLTYIYGIGRSSANKICKSTNINNSKRTGRLSGYQIMIIRKYIQSNYIVEGALRREISMNIKRMMDVGSYRGLRHRRGLPVRGQRTRTNARTRKKHKV